MEDPENKSEESIVGTQKENLLSGTNKSAYVLAIVVVVVCSVVARLILPFFQLANIVMLYLLGIIMVATRCGRGPSILTSVLSVIAFDFFCVPPYQTFSASDTEYLITLVVMLIVGLVISNLTVTIRQQATDARLREKYTAALFSMSRELSSTLDPKHLIETGLHHISEVFDSKVALLLPTVEKRLELVSSGEDKRQLVDADISIATLAYRNGAMAGLGTELRTTSKELYVPLLSAEKSIGVLAIRPGQPDLLNSPKQLRLLETFANQLALAYERAQFLEKSELARLQVKSEQLRNSLLSSVSHDLRTPLATIAGAASSIVEATDAVDVRSYKEMAREIYDESMRLNRLVGNLLDMTKLQSGTLQVTKQLHPVDEIIGAALSCIEDRLTNHPVRICAGPDVPIVAVDATLIQQVLLNLIENAVKYTPEGSEIEIGAESAANAMVQISVADHGPGVTPQNHHKIFEKFFRERPSQSSGAGLGLAICTGIVEAHGGKIWVENRPSGGAIFKFTVPAPADLLPPNLEEQESEVRDEHA